MLGLPVFAMRWDDVTKHAALWMETPFNWVLLAGEVLFDYTTSRSVASLVATTSGLTASVVLTVQRFLSLVFSAAVLNAPPPPPSSLWVGSGMVLLGSCMYILAPRSSSGSTSSGCAGDTSTGDGDGDEGGPSPKPPPPASSSAAGVTPSAINPGRGLAGLRLRGRRSLGLAAGTGGGGAIGGPPPPQQQEEQEEEEQGDSEVAAAADVGSPPPLRRTRSSRS